MSPSETQSEFVAASGNLEPGNGVGSVLRNQEIEEATNKYFIHKISLALVPVFMRLGLSPNIVSCMGAACGVLAAVCYYQYDRPVSCFLGFALMIGWHVLDGADGQLARRTGKVTASGFFIDGICDYVTFICVYIALGLSLSQDYGQWIWVLVLLAGLFHAIQAAAFEMQRDFYQQSASDSLWTTGTQEENGDGDGGEASSRMWVLQIIARAYFAVQDLFRPISRSFIQTVRGCEDKALNTPALGEKYRSTFKGAVLAWSVLSANNRTLAIFLFCIAGVPLYYFVYELFVLNAVLFALINLNKSKQADLTRQLDLA